MDSTPVTQKVGGWSVEYSILNFYLQRVWCWPLLLIADIHSEWKESAFR